MKKINIKITLIVLLAICFAGGMKAQAIKVDRGLWGEWYLQSIEKLTFNDDKVTNVQKIAVDAMSINTILKTKSVSIQNIFTVIHFFNDNTLGVCSLKEIKGTTDFVPLSINSKGSYLLKDDHLTIITGEQPVEYNFTYKVLNDNLLEVVFRSAENNQNGQKLVYAKND
ncbi:MAG: hypothetical protein ACK5KT_13355 [Dysgonomonas sp.]